MYHITGIQNAFDSYEMSLLECTTGKKQMVFRYILILYFINSQNNIQIKKLIIWGENTQAEGLLLGCGGFIGGLVTMAM